MFDLLKKKLSDFSKKLTGKIEEKKEIQPVKETKQETKEEITEEDEGFVHQEVRYGSFARRIPLPSEVKAEKAEATIKD